MGWEDIVSERSVPMVDNSVPLFVRIFFSICALLALFSFLKPEKIINVTAKWFKWSLKLYGFEGEIRPTPKAKIICRFWNAFMFFVFAALLLFLK
jgi:hypothetical protein